MRSCGGLEGCCGAGFGCGAGCGHAGAAAPAATSGWRTPCVLGGELVALGAVVGLGAGADPLVHAAGGRRGVGCVPAAPEADAGDTDGLMESVVADTEGIGGGLVVVVQGKRGDGPGLGGGEGGGDLLDSEGFDDAVFGMVGRAAGPVGSGAWAEVAEVFAVAVGVLHLPDFPVNGLPAGAYQRLRPGPAVGLAQGDGDGGPGGVVAGGHVPGQGSVRCARFAGERVEVGEGVAVSNGRGCDHGVSPLVSRAISASSAVTLAWWRSSEQTSGMPAASASSAFSARACCSLAYRTASSRCPSAVRFSWIFRANASIVT